MSFVEYSASSECSQLAAQRDCDPPCDAQAGLIEQSSLALQISLQIASSVPVLPSPQYPLTHFPIIFETIHPT